MPERLARLLAVSDKPLVAVVDSGPRYEPLVRALREGGVPVFPSADQAIRSLGRYLCERAAARAPAQVPAQVPEAATVGATPSTLVGG